MSALLGLLGSWKGAPRDSVARHSAKLAPNPTGSRDSTDRIPFCPTFRALFYVCPPDFRIAFPAGYGEFLPPYLEHCMSQNIRPDSFQWRDSDLLEFFLFIAIVEILSSQEEVILVSPPSSSHMSSQLEPKRQVGPDSVIWPAVTMLVWDSLPYISRGSPSPSAEFTTLLVEGYPVYVAPIVDLWFNELRLFDFAEEIEKDFDASWIRIPAFSWDLPLHVGSRTTEVATSGEIALSPSEFTLSES